MALALVAAACGSDGDGSGGAFGVGGDDTSSGSDATGGGDDDTGGTDSGGDTGAGSNTDFCQGSDEINAALDDLDFFGPPAEVEQNLNTAIGLMNQYANSAPGEIQGSVNEAINTFEAMRDIMSEYDYDILLASGDPRFEELSNSTAPDEIDAFCGVDDDPISSTDDGGVPGLPNTEDLGEIDPGDGAAILAQIFNVDAQTAECLVNEGYDEDAITAAIASQGLSAEICGTTIGQLIAGIAG